MLKWVKALWFNMKYGDYIRWSHVEMLAKEIGTPVEKLAKAMARFIDEEPEMASRHWK